MASTAADTDQTQEANNDDTNEEEPDENAEAQPPTASSDPHREDHHKPPAFLQRPIKVKNPGQINHTFLVESLLGRFKTGYFKWRNKAKVFHFAHVLVTVIVIMLQVSQVIIFQIPVLSFEVKTALATVFPTLTGAALALQLRLGWAEKGHKCEAAAKLYKKLTKHMEYRLEMHSSGGHTEDIDTVLLWNTALLSENDQVPSYISLC